VIELEKGECGDGLTPAQKEVLDLLGMPPKKTAGQPCSTAELIMSGIREFGKLESRLKRDRHIGQTQT